MPDEPAHVRDAIGLLIEAETWMERQLNNRLRGTNHRRDNDEATLRLPSLPSTSDIGINHDPQQSAKRLEY